MAAITPARELFDLTGEVALVTGASSGLGQRFAEVLAAHGASVVLAARRSERIEALSQRLGKAMAITLDETKPDTFETAFKAMEARFGPVTLLINNAGTATSGAFLKTSRESWERVIDTNVSALWHLSQAFARRLVATKNRGSIINVASILGFRVRPGVSAYSISKAAVVQMTQALAVALACDGIRVNGIAPGYIWSEMTEEFLKSEVGQAMIKTIPLRRVGEPSDLDGSLLLLASRKASDFMTGSTITVDGGHMWAFL